MNERAKDYGPPTGDRVPGSPERKAVEWIGWGISRRVFLVGGWAFKAPHMRRGIAQFYRGCMANYSEQVWSDFKDADEHPNLARPNPVIFKLPAGLLNVYRRAEPFRFAGDPEEMQETMAEWAGFFGDAKDDNFGVLDGEIVLLDYDTSTKSCRHCNAPISLAEPKEPVG